MTLRAADLDEPGARAERGARGWRRTFWVVCASNLIAGAGIMCFLPFFPSLLLELGMQDAHARALWSGVLFGAAPLAAAFTGPLWGSVGDRYGRKLMVVRALCGLALFVGLMAFARSAWQLLFLRIAQGVVSGYFAPSLTLVSVVAPRARQGQVTSWLQAASALGTIAGPLLGVLLLAHGVSAVFSTVAGAAALSALLVWAFALEDESRRARAELGSLAAMLRATWHDLRALLANTRVRQGLGLYAAVHFALGATNPLMEFLVESVTGEKVSPDEPARVAALTATLFSVLAVSSIAATPLWGRLGDRFGHALALRLASALSALSLIAQALVPSYAWLFGARLAFGLVSPGASAAAFGLAAMESETTQRGAAMGAVFSVRSFALSAGAFLGGAVAGVLGIRGLFAAAGAVIALGLLLRRKT